MSARRSGSLQAPGTVSFVGAGPGDPELLTLRAARRIDEADDLVVDALVAPEVYAGCSARVVYVGKRAGRPSISQPEIESILVELALRGRRVVRLKGGDPSLFGRLAEEIAALENAGIGYEIVPGITSALAAPAAAGLTVTDRDLADRVVVVTGHRRADRDPLPLLPEYREGQTVVLLMALGQLDSLVEQALALGYPSELPAAIVSRATLPDQRVVAAPLREIAAHAAEASIERPATVVFGWIAGRALVVESKVAERLSG